MQLHAEANADAEKPTTRICNGEIKPKASNPQQKIVAAAEITALLVIVNRAKSGASRTRIPIRDGISFQSPSRPPRRLPNVSPTPNRSSISVTEPAESLVTFSRIGVMYVSTPNRLAEARTLITIARSTCVLPSDRASWISRIGGVGTSRGSQA